MPRLPDRPLAAAVLAIGVAAALSAAAGDDAPSSTASASPAAPATDAGGTGTAGTTSAAPTGTATAPAGTTTSTGAGSASSGTFTDGTYEASGTYQSPAGRESVSVSLTVAGDRVTAVEVTPGATGGPSKEFQDAFVGGIAGVVVGRPLATLSVDTVAGSSLTGQGFDQAVERIRTEATS